MAKNSIKKPERGLGQAVNSARSNARRAVAREQAQRRARVLDDMRGEAERHVNEGYTERRREANEDQRKSISLVRVVAAQQQAVVDSYGLDLPIRVEAAYTFSAKTDYRSIHIGWSANDLPDFGNVEDVAEAIIAFRGACQHELGHNLHSIRPQVFWGHPSTKKVVEGTGVTIAEFMHMANVLEDQRMECRMVAAVPRLAAYFTVMCGKWLDGRNQWFLVAGRSYLPDEVRALALASFTKPEIAQPWLDIVNRYKVARSVKAMAEAVVEGITLTQGMRVDEGTEHVEHWWDRNARPEETAAADDRAADGASEPSIMPPNPISTSAEDAEGAAKNGQESGDQEGSESAQEGSESDQEGSESAQEGTGATTGSNDEEAKAKAKAKATDEAIQKAAREAADEIKQLESEELAETVDEISRSIENFRLPNLPADRQAPPSRLLVDLSLKIKERMRSSLQGWVTAAAPVWQSHQEQGVLDALAWRTHRTGERDYHRSMSGTGSEGLDIHLTLMCDASGSMSDHMMPLSAVMYGTAAACDELGIDRTMTLWSDNQRTYRVWDGIDSCPALLDSDGGTDPTIALDDMENHNENGRGHHVVIIFTDGVWGTFGSLQQWAGDNRKIILVKFGPDAGNFTYGADHSIKIDSITDMEYHIAAALDDTLASIY